MLDSGFATAFVPAGLDRPLLRLNQGATTKSSAENTGLSVARNGKSSVAADVACGYNLDADYTVFSPLPFASE
jgi:hypothetical protein